MTFRQQFRRYDRYALSILHDTFCQNPNISISLSSVRVMIETHAGKAWTGNGALSDITHVYGQTSV